MQRAGASGTLNVRIDDKTFPGANGEAIQAVRDLAFCAETNSCTALVGPSGCGKTTILRIIAGLDRDFAGNVSLNRSAPESARISFAFQEPTLLPWRSLEENVRLTAAPDLSNEDLDLLLNQAEIAEFRHRFPAELSLGLARRASIVRALAAKPDLLLLDEPFVSLDNETASKLRQLVARLLDQETVTALLVTHDLAEAVELADRVISLSARPARMSAERPLSTARAKRTPAILKKYLAQFEQAARAARTK